MDNYNQTCNELLEVLGTSQQGLTHEEAARRLEKYGHNQLHQAERTPLWRLILDAWKDSMMLILAVVVIIKAVLGEFFEAAVILAVLVVNSLISVIQTRKAEGSLEALRRLSAPMAKVRRNKEVATLPASELVAGDIVLLEAGDFIPADGRVIVCNALKVDEGLLTGESEPVHKLEGALEGNLPLGDRKNMVYSGTIVVYGRGEFLVTGTGKEAEIGKIATLIETAQDRQTPLQRRLDDFSKKLGLAIMVLCTLIFAVQIARAVTDGGELRDVLLGAFLFAIAVAVAAIPEALSSIVTIVLAVGTKKMATQNAIIRKLPAVEALGSTGVICTDKTGTLTQNKMTVMDYFLPGSLFNETCAKSSQTRFTGQHGSPLDDAEVKGHDLQESLLLPAMVLCNDAIVKADGTTIGDPTEVALLNFSNESGNPYDEIRKVYTRLAELPFDSERKLMSVAVSLSNEGNECSNNNVDALRTLDLHQNCFPHRQHKSVEERSDEVIQENYSLRMFLDCFASLAMTAKSNFGASLLNRSYNEVEANLERSNDTIRSRNACLLFTKGAPDVLFSRCTYVLIGDKIVPISPELLTRFEDANNRFSSNALRVLAFAAKAICLAEVPSLSSKDEHALILIGLAAMKDPPRPEVYQSIAAAKAAKIKTVMITGDHINTACAIAKEIGIIQDGDIAITGAQLDTMTQAELDQKLENISVYARVSPENKIAIVNAWQKKGMITAMTGDGVNDAPSLKQADIGVAMGSGTEVAKDAAAMVLADDNFVSIVSAVAVGRTIFDNIKKAVGYLFSGNLAAIIAILFAFIIGWDSPLTALQILFINLVNDSIPAIALGLEKSEPNTMTRPPRNMNEGIFGGGLFASVVKRGVLIGAAAILSQFIGITWFSPAVGGAMAFTTIILARTLQTFSSRSNSQTIFGLGFASNLYVMWAVIACMGLYGLTVLPGLRAVFHIPPVFAALHLGIAAGLAVAAVLVMEAVKWIRNKNVK